MCAGAYVKGLLPFLDRLRRQSHRISGANPGRISMCAGVQEFTCKIVRVTSTGFKLRCWGHGGHGSSCQVLFVKTDLSEAELAECIQKALIE